MTWLDYFVTAIINLATVLFAVIVIALITHAVYMVFIAAPMPVIALFAFFIIAGIIATCAWGIERYADK